MWALSFACVGGGVENAKESGRAWSEVGWGGGLGYGWGWGVAFTPIGWSVVPEEFLAWVDILGSCKY